MKRVKVRFRSSSRSSSRSISRSGFKVLIKVCFLMTVFQGFSVCFLLLKSFVLAFLEYMNRVIRNVKDNLKFFFKVKDKKVRS